MPLTSLLSLFEFDVRSQVQPFQTAARTAHLDVGWVAVASSYGVISDAAELALKALSGAPPNSAFHTKGVLGTRHAPLSRALLVLSLERTVNLLFRAFHLVRRHLTKVSSQYCVQRSRPIVKDCTSTTSLYFAQRPLAPAGRIVCPSRNSLNISERWRGIMLRSRASLS